MGSAATRTGSRIGAALVLVALAASLSGCFAAKSNPRPAGTYSRQNLQAIAQALGLGTANELTTITPSEEFSDKSQAKDTSPASCIDLAMVGITPYAASELGSISGYSIRGGVGSDAQKHGVAWFSARVFPTAAAAAAYESLLAGEYRKCPAWKRGGDGLLVLDGPSSQSSVEGWQDLDALENADVSAKEFASRTLGDATSWTFLVKQNLLLIAESSGSTSVASYVASVANTALAR